jgi:hypothetical protein
MQIVVTTIFPPTDGVIEIARGLERVGGDATLWVMGDRKGPDAYDIPATRFFSISDQERLPFRIAGMLSEGSYTRKNLGYLLAIGGKPPFIVETDDDNIPLPGFWEAREANVAARTVNRAGWFNVYRAFSRAKVWPRGFPLERLQSSWADLDAVESELTSGTSFIQQGLANENPDVDAVYRLVGDLPLDFEEEPPVRLEPGCWCPFNSQNTAFFPSAFPLLYLPTHCSFRMTDIWRSFVAQRCLWAMGSVLTFAKATVFQRRNEHSLLRDFKDEISGYLQNERIRGVLEGVDLRSGTNPEDVEGNLHACYEALVREEIVPPAELALVEAWLGDLRDVRG